MNMKLKAPLILASGSPRRKDLLEKAGIDFTIVLRNVYEFHPDDLQARAVAVLISENKAKAYDDLAPKNIVLTADTVVALDDHILGKPEDEAHAFMMLKSLSGRTHSVITAVTIFYKGKFRSFAEETIVHVKPLSDSLIHRYIKECNPMDKAGAYGIQDWFGEEGIDRIEGDYYNVMGLPIDRVIEELKAYEK